MWPYIMSQCVQKCLYDVLASKIISGFAFGSNRVKKDLEAKVHCGALATWEALGNVIPVVADF